MTHDVFISYSSKDKLVADAACAMLEARGLRCWIAPRDIVPGMSWAAAIPGAIGAAKVFLLIFSRNANESDQVQREVDVAATRRLAIIPMRIENVMPEQSLEYYIHERHWLDAFTPPLEQHLSRLADAIGLLLSGETDGAAAEPARAIVFTPQPGRSFGPYLLGAAALLSAALVAFGWVAFHREAAPRKPEVITVPGSQADLDRVFASDASRKSPSVYARPICGPVPLGLKEPAQVCVTSALATQQDDAGKVNTYGPQSLFDNDPKTAWCEGVKGPGIGEEIRIAFAQPVVAGGITVVNGYAKSAAAFANNNSVHTLTAIWPDGTTSKVELGDSITPQTVELHHDAPVTQLSLRIVSVNGGSKWPDTCISELKVSLRAP